jgi:two-component system OmpR family response regulator
MKNLNRIKIFLVDDDAVFLKLLEIQFKELVDLDIYTYATGEDCLKELDIKPDLIVLDYHLDGIDKIAMTGIETLDKIKSYNPAIPVVILSCQDKIEVAVDCMHHKAYDYVVKSETAFTRLQNILTAIFKFNKMETQLSWYMNRM